MTLPTLAPSSAGTGRPAHSSVAQTLAFLHPWIDFVPKQRRRLGLFICLALLVHLGAFFFIRIDTSRAELQHRARTHVTTENARIAPSRENADAFWDQLTDPRLYLMSAVFLNQVPADEPPLDFASINSNMGAEQLPAPLQLQTYPVSRPDAPHPEQEVSGDMIPVRQPFSYDETPPPQITNTRWQWGSNLAGREPSNVPSLPSPTSSTDLNPTQILVAVNAAGTVEHVLLEETSQKPELDQQAILAARKIRFRPDASDLTWGRVTIYWHYTTPPREVVLPTPATP